MKPPFDISGDLDTPVSAYLKLAAFKPRFLLESVEGGERLGRYSFIGFGDGLEVKLDSHALMLGTERRPVPQSTTELLSALREALSRAPRPLPDMPGVPLAGGLVGYAGYDLVRFFERLPGRKIDKPVLSNNTVTPVADWVPVGSSSRTTIRRPCCTWSRLAPTSRAGG